MTEEKNEQCTCICKTEGFKKFVIVALGTFVGGFCALSLFVALHKPPMPPCPMHKYMAPTPFEQQKRHWNKSARENVDIQRPPVDEQRPPINVEQPPIREQKR